MNNRYQEYDPKEFEYDYPYSWEKRNKKYLEKTDDRDVIITPINDYLFKDEEEESEGE